MGFRNYTRNERKYPMTKLPLERILVHSKETSCTNFLKLRSPNNETLPVLLLSRDRRWYVFYDFLMSHNEMQRGEDHRTFTRSKFKALFKLKDITKMHGRSTLNLIFLIQRSHLPKFTYVIRGPRFPDLRNKSQVLSFLD